MSLSFDNHENGENNSLRWLVLVTPTPCLQKQPVMLTTNDRDTLS